MANTKTSIKDLEARLERYMIKSILAVETLDPNVSSVMKKDICHENAQKDSVVGTDPASSAKKWVI